MYVIITVNLSQDTRTKYTIDRINGFRQGMRRQSNKVNDFRQDMGRQGNKLNSFRLDMGRQGNKVNDFRQGIKETE